MRGLLLFVLPLAACVNTSPPPSSSLEASDGGVFVPGVRLSAGFDGLGIAPSQQQAGGGVEIGWSRGGGSDTQTLASGQPPVRFGDRTFSPPGELRHDFDFRYFDVATRLRGFPGAGPIGLEALFGVGFASLDLRTASSTQNASESMDSAGLSLGLGLIGRLRPGTSAHARATFFSGPGGGVIRAQRLEVSLVHALWPHVAVRAGYVAWSVESERENDGVSPIRVKLSGPTLGLDLAF